MKKKPPKSMPGTMGRVIFVGPHPDDIELSCGGTVARFVELGYEVQCVFLTEGQHLANGDNRKKESTEACTLLGVKSNNIVFGPFCDRCIPMSFETIDYLDQLYLKDPDNVYAAFVPSNNDKHQDHRASFWCGLSAFRHVNRLFAYETPSSTSEFNPTAFVDISHLLDKKWQALQCHRSQIKQRKVFMEYEAMIGLASFRGRQAEVKYAEAFQTIKNLL